MRSAYSELNDVESAECGSSTPQQEHARRRKLHIAAFSAASCLLIAAGVLLRSSKQPTKNVNERVTEAKAQSFQCNCPPSEAIRPCTAEEHRALLSGDNCPYYASHPKAAKISVAASTGVACAVCKGGETSLQCRACQNGMSASDFCESCVSQGLNDIGCTNCRGAVVEQMHECNCPPTEVIYPCTADQRRALLNGTACPYYASHSRVALELMGGDRDRHGCISSAGYTWCGKESNCIRRWEHGIHDEATMTAKCGNVVDVSGEQMYECNCPPSEAIYTCTAKEHQDLLSGTTCPYYASLRSSGEQSYQCNCPPSEVIYPCNAEQHRALLSGTTCPYYASHHNR